MTIFNPSISTLVALAEIAQLIDGTIDPAHFDWSAARHMLANPNVVSFLDAMHREGFITDSPDYTRAGNLSPVYVQARRDAERAGGGL